VSWQCVCVCNVCNSQFNENDDLDILMCVNINDDDDVSVWDDINANDIIIYLILIMCNINNE